MGEFSVSDKDTYILMQFYDKADIWNVATMAQDLSALNKGKPVIALIEGDVAFVTSRNGLNPDKLGEALNAE